MSFFNRDPQKCRDPQKLFKSIPVFPTENRWMVDESTSRRSAFESLHRGRHLPEALQPASVQMH